MSRSSLSFGRAAKRADDEGAAASAHEMVRNVFRLADRQIGSPMVPRSDIVRLDVTRPLDENLALMAQSFHSRFPVCRGGPEDVRGAISSKELFTQMLRGDQVDLTQGLQDAAFVPKSLTGMELLDQFRASGTQMVFVIDEYGEIQGMVTLQDVIESVTGEFIAEDHQESWAVQREDGSWFLDGLTPVPELKDRLGLKTVPEEEKGRYHTLSGMVMWVLGRVPNTGDVATWDGCRLEVVDLDGKRIDKVMASPLPQTPATGTDDPPRNHPESCRIGACSCGK